MKSLIKAVALAVVFAAPAVSFAQSNQPVTRAQVRAELVQLEQVGYQPGNHDTQYPSDIQAAEARVAGRNGGTPAAVSDVGGVVGGAVQSGAPVRATGAKSIYFGQ